MIKTDDKKFKGIKIEKKNQRLKFNISISRRIKNKFNTLIKN